MERPPQQSARGLTRPMQASTSSASLAAQQDPPAAAASSPACLPGPRHRCFFPLCPALRTRQAPLVTRIITRGPWIFQLGCERRSGQSKLVQKKCQSGRARVSGHLARRCSRSPHPTATTLPGMPWAVTAAGASPAGGAGDSLRMTADVQRMVTIT